MFFLTRRERSHPEKSPTLPRSPYKTRLTKRPHHRGQLPKRSEQVNAATAFVPHPDSEQKMTVSAFETSFPDPSISVHPYTAAPSISPRINLPSTPAWAVTTTQVVESSNADPQNPADSTFDNLKSAETILSNNATSSSSLTTTIKPQGITSTVKTSGTLKLTSTAPQPQGHLSEHY